MSKVRRQHYLNACKVKTSADSSLRCHSNLKQRADRQKIQMNALFLPGVSKKELMKRCACLGVADFRQPGTVLARRRSPAAFAQTESNCWWRSLRRSPRWGLCRCHCDARNPITLFRKLPLLWPSVWILISCLDLYQYGSCQVCSAAH